MSTQVQFRRGTTTQNNAFTGAAGELSVDSTLNVLRLHDGTTAGGNALLSANAVQTALNKTFSTGSVWTGTAVGLGYGGTGSAITANAGSVAYSTSNGLALTASGTSGQILVSGGIGAPTWVSSSSISAGSSTLAATATNIAGGSAGQLIIQQDVSTTTFITAGAAGTFLKSAGAGYAPQWATGAVTYGTTTVALGGSSTSIAGLTSLDGTSSVTLFASPTTIAFGAAGTAITIGASTGTTTVNNNMIVSGTLTVNGSTTYVTGNNTVYTDNLIELHAPTGGVGGTWSTNDGKDIGLRMHYYNGGDQNAALILANDSQQMEFYVTGTENGSGDFVGAAYGTFKGKAFNHQNIVLRDAFSASTSGTTATAIYSFATASYRSGEFTIQVTNNGAYRITRLMIVHDGTNVTLSENYLDASEIQTNATNTTFTASIATGTLTLYATAASNTSAVKGSATLIAI